MLQYWSDASAISILALLALPKNLHYFLIECQSCPSFHFHTSELALHVSITDLVERLFKLHWKATILINWKIFSVSECSLLPHAQPANYFTMIILTTYPQKHWEWSHLQPPQRTPAHHIAHIAYQTKPLHITDTSNYKNVSWASLSQLEHSRRFWCHLHALKQPV